jgi:hypothetical protein
MPNVSLARGLQVAPRCIAVPVVLASDTFATLRTCRAGAHGRAWRKFCKFNIIFGPNVQQ